MTFMIILLFQFINLVNKNPPIGYV